MWHKMMQSMLKANNVEKKKVMHQFIELKMTWKCEIAPSVRTTQADKFSLFKKKKNWFIPTYRKNVTR